MMSRKLGMPALVLSLLALTLSVSGCGFVAQKAAEKTIEGATGNKVDVQGDKVTIKGEDGTQVDVGGEQKIPDGFPKDVPVYDGAKIIGSTTSADSSGAKGYTISYLAKDQMPKVGAWYKRELKAEGWKPLMSAETGDGVMMTSEKGDFTVSVGVNPSSTEQGFSSQVVVTVGPR